MENLVFNALFILIFITTSCHGDQKVLLFLLDGLRHDYPIGEQAGFKNIIDQGVKAKTFKPVFPSLSFTNYYSIATGLYPESHGVIHNYFYDPTEDAEFLIGSKESDFAPFWWKDGEPVWISAEKAGKKAVMYYWPGCEAMIQNRLPSICEKYVTAPSSEDFSNAIDEALKELAGGAEFAAIYYEYVDKNGHLNGVGSPSVLEHISNISSRFQRMSSEMESTFMTDGITRLSDVTNVIAVSDHGMSSSGPGQRIVLGDFIDQSNLERSLPSNTSDPVVQLWPAEGQMDSIFEILSNIDGLTAYKKSDLLDRWHLKNNDRVAPITIVADNHYALLPPTYDGNPSLYAWYNGMHGYDNDLPEMGGIFLAAGPAFKSGIEIDELKSTDVYQMMCSILGVPEAPNNGTWENVSDLLNTNSAVKVQYTLTLFVMLTLAFLYK